ncbi:MAG TPA: septal ring lytic transglycosylase RlpA family protein [Candidatus Acidoferrales bacterium]|nr:septal ring lytic transglycosylase RlpA family protein [Candidatus Acidoferrales bacterium]
MRWRLVVVVGLSTILAGCGLFRSRPTIEERPGATQTGVASWYGPGFHGNNTSSGEVYDQNELTAAHQTLPLGTLVSVSNLDNGRQVEVRVNDRGPFAKGRIIDLSYAAARALDMIGPGTANVRVEVVGASRSNRLPTSAYAVQVGSFSDHDNALRLKTTLARRFDGVYVATSDGNAGRFYRVRLGRFNRREDALRTARAVVPLGLTAIIVEDGVSP